MKKIISYVISIVIAIGIILLVKPYIDENNKKNQHNFAVNSNNGELSLDSYKGKVLAIYFGYMYCPDVCPTSLSSLAQALQGVSSEKLKNFEGLFISVDPDRDSLKDLEDYAKYFHPTFKGATSDKENIDDIVKRYGAFYQKVYLEGSSMDYSVSHTSYIYFFDKDGNYVKKVDHASYAEELPKVLESLL